MIHRASASLVSALITIASGAQHFTGQLSFPEGANHKVVLWTTIGSEHLRYDSTRADARGAFTFQRKLPGAGFYQLSLNDSDRVDVILTPAEKEVSIEFTGAPLQQNVHILKSDENMRLWEYKLVSREAQAIHAAADAERRTLDPTNVPRARELDSIGYRADLLREQHLARLISAAPRSYFGKAVGANRRVEQAMPEGRRAVARVFDFGDPELLRSSVYARAIASYLQCEPPTSEEEFFNNIDSLLTLTRRDTGCFHYTLGFLIELFGQYGPELAVTYVIDHWIALLQGPVPLPARIQEKVDDQLRLALGRTAPDIDLPDHARTLKLSSLVRDARYTTIMFYSSTCDHCREQMPHVRDQLVIYREKGYRVIGIALDSDSAEFAQAIKNEGITWPVYSEFKGFGGAAVKAFKVEATPYFYVLDNELRIVAKPINYLELGARLKELFAQR